MNPKIIIPRCNCHSAHCFECTFLDMPERNVKKMITYNQFNQIILSLRELDTFRNRLREVGVDLEVFNDLQYTVCNAYEAAIFNPVQNSVLDWWLYDANGIEKDPDPSTPLQWDEEGNEMPIHSVKELYDYLMTLEGFPSEPVPADTTEQFTILFQSPRRAD